MKDNSKYLNQVGVLTELFNCSAKDLTKHSKTIYSWKEMCYEVVSKNNLTAPHSHYIQITKGKHHWYLRELGKKSKLYPL